MPVSCEVIFKHLYIYIYIYIQQYTNQSKITQDHSLRTNVKHSQKTKQNTSRTATTARPNCLTLVEFQDLKWAPLDGRLGFRRRRLGPNSAVGCAGHCVNRRYCTRKVKHVYIYIYTQCFLDLFEAAQTSTLTSYRNNPSILVLGPQPSSALLSVV